jgi:hypothetical protein
MIRISRPFVYSRLSFTTYCNHWHQTPIDAFQKLLVQSRHLGFVKILKLREPGLDVCCRDSLRDCNGELILLSRDCVDFLSGHGRDAQLMAECKFVGRFDGLERSVDTMCWMDVHYRGDSMCFLYCLASDNIRRT